MSDPSIIDRNRQATLGGYGEGSSPYAFPNDLGRHATIIQFRDYSYRQGAVGQGSRRQALSGNFVGATADGFNESNVILPLPKQFIDNASVNVNGRDIEPQGAAAADAAANRAGLRDFGGSIVDDIINTFSSEEGGNLGSILSGGANIARYASRAGLGAIAPNISSGIDAGLGTTVNPHQTLTFDGVPLKQHTFSWDLAPKSFDDTMRLAEIIKRLKKAMYPKYRTATGGSSSGGGTSLSRALLSYPSIAHISFVGINQSSFYYLKPAMIRDLNVDYTPQGNALLAGGHPSIVTLTMTVLEQEIHTSDDYELQHQMDVDINPVGSGSQ